MVRFRGTAIRLFRRYRRCTSPRPLTGPPSVSRLLELGADVLARNRRGAEPLHAASAGAPGGQPWNPKRQAATIELLIDAGADPDCRRHGRRHTAARRRAHPLRCRGASAAGAGRESSREATTPARRRCTLPFRRPGKVEAALPRRRLSKRRSSGCSSSTARERPTRTAEGKPSLNARAAPRSPSSHTSQRDPSPPSRARRQRHSSRAADAGPSRRSRHRGDRRKPVGDLVHVGPRARPGRRVHRQRARRPARRATCCRGPCATRRAARSSARTRYHDIVAPIDRVEIGWTWYAARYQRTHVNTTCKLLLLTHAFESLEVRGRRSAHRQLQLCVPARDRAPRREEGRSASPSHGPPRRDGERHASVQHHRVRVERRSAASLASAGAKRPGSAGAVDSGSRLLHRQEFGDFFAVPFGLHLLEHLRDRARGSMTNVVRRIPMYLRPNIDFSRPHAVLHGDRVIDVGDERVRKIVFLLEFLM